METQKNVQGEEDNIVWVLKMEIKNNYKNCDTGKTGRRTAIHRINVDKQKVR
jgi:hypothetical protein